MTTLQEVRARFARDQGLPFADSLSKRSILEALNEHGAPYRDRLFRPVTTIWGFLSQVLSEDHSCRDPVARVLAHRAASGLKPCSPNAASYCNARGRLPTGVLRPLARRTAQQLQDGLPEGWQWHGRRVFIADGSHVSMPDTPENQARYPQPPQQQPASASRWPGSPSCCRWRPAPATTWPSRRTPARAPARPRCCDSCTARSNPATWPSPTPCSTTTSSPANCASAASSWSPVCRRSAWAAGR